MKITVLTLFPELIEAYAGASILGRAQESGILEVGAVNLRDFGLGARKQVDDTPYGGGAGMVLKVDVVAAAIKKLRKDSGNSKVILMTPQGATFTQSKAKELACEMVNGKCDLILVCGHYEGFDERIRDYVDEEISVGDYIITGGELAAAIVLDAVARLIPGVLGKEASFEEESFSLESTNNSNLKTKTLLEYPHYTRPEEFEGKKVPEILLSGHHAEIEKWRKAEAVKKTKERRPDLLR